MNNSSRAIAQQRDSTRMRCKQSASSMQGMRELSRNSAIQAALQKGISEVCPKRMHSGKPKADTKRFHHGCRSLNLFQVHLEKNPVEKIKKEYAGISSCVLAFSGGKDSVLVASLLQKAGIKLTTATLDFGQEADFPAIRKLALRHSKKHCLVDGKGQLLANCHRGIKANCVAEGYLQATSFSTSVLASSLVDIARKGGIQAIAHGFSGVGNDQIRFENAVYALAPEKVVLAPIRDFNIKHEVVSGVNESFWAREIKHAGGSVPPGAFKLVKNKGGKPAKVQIFFENGMPTELYVMKGSRVGDTFGRGELIPALNKIAGAAGMGKFDIIVDKVIGLKQRELHEAPAAQVLVAAHRELESLILTSNEQHVKNEIDHTWNKLVYEGFWYSRLRLALDSFIDEIERSIDGSVTYEMACGGLNLVERKSHHALYDQRLSSTGAEGMFNQKDARYFIKLYGLENTLAFRRDLD